MIRAILVFFFVSAAPVAALDITLPATARQTVARNTSPDVYSAPSGVFQNGAVPTFIIEGEVRRAAWRLESPGLTPLQIMRPLRQQLQAAGLEIILDCASTTCGGFDFRFATETLPGPNMYVNIRRYHFVSAVRKVAGQVTEVVTVLTSTSTSSAYVQIIQAGALDQGGVSIATTAELPIAQQPVGADDLAARLLRDGHVLLADLEFSTGNTNLGPGPYKTLQKLAAFMERRPEMRIALVGHTDTVGGLDGNITISKQRAQSVRQRLASAFGIGLDRMDAEGMGYLAPLTNNLDAKGREQNRRVEAILLSNG